VIAEYAKLDATALAALIARGEVSAAEVREEALARIAANQALGAVAQLYTTPPPPLPGPFHGVPFLVKDNVIARAGQPVSAIHRWLGGATASTTATLAGRHDAAGLVTLGSTTIPELSLSFTSEPEDHAPARNPFDPARGCGGSSGGSAAAVAAGLVPMAHGTDGAGSIRVPAAHCGLVGFKPSRIRTPLGPEAAEGLAGMSYAHALTRSVRDSAALLDATHGPERGDPYAVPPPARPYLAELQADPPPLRIALTTASPLGNAVAPEIITAVEDTARLLERLGHHVETAAPAYEINDLAAAWRLIAGVAALGAARRASRLTGRDAMAALEPVNTAWVAEAAAASAPDYAATVQLVHCMGRRLGAFFTHYDVLLSPVTAALAPRLGELAGKGLSVDEFNRKFWEHAPFTCVFNASGGPAVSLPLGRSATGLPIGVHLGADFGQDSMLFALCGQLERARPWAGSYPA
jgi:amidase